MKFLALLKKELRECLPWIALATIIMLGWAGLLLEDKTRGQTRNWEFRTFNPDVSINSVHPPLQDPGLILFFTSIGLGLVLGFQQYWMPGFRGLWPFLLHRSAARKTILWAKITTGALAMAISCGATWTLLYLYSCQTGLFWTPPAIRFLIEGWILVSSGFVVYLAAALCGLSVAKWYTTKIFALAFAGVIFIASFGECQLKWTLILLAIGVLVILIQLFDTFLNREF